MFLFNTLFAYIAVKTG